MAGSDAAQATQDYHNVQVSDSDDEDMPGGDDPALNQYFDDNGMFEQMKRDLLAEDPESEKVMRSVERNVRRKIINARAVAAAGGAPQQG